MDDDVTVPAQGDGGTGEAGPELAVELRDMWERLDPVPDGLAERVVFALEVEAFTSSDLELELMRLQQPQATGTGARGEQVRTVTFGSESLTVMLAISDVDGGHRVDGWVAPGGRRPIEVRTSAGSDTTRCDETGRFALALVPPGHFQLVLGEVGEDAADGSGHQAGADGRAGRATVTPALTL